MWYIRHSRLKVMNIWYRVALVFAGTFVFALLVLNSRFLYAYLQFEIRGTPLQKFVFDSKTVVHLPISSFKKSTPLPNEAQLVLDTIGVVVPIVFDPTADQAGVYKDLEKGVVQYPDSVKPGQAGTSIILGHSSAFPWYPGKYGAVFALLDKLKTGDIINVQYADGRLFRYKVYGSVVFNPFVATPIDESSLALPNSNTLVLLSCWPVGTSYKRIAIKAVLI